MSIFPKNRTWPRAAAVNAARLCAGIALGWGARMVWASLETPDGGSARTGRGAAVGAPTPVRERERREEEIFPPGATPFQQMTLALRAGDGLSAGEIRDLLARADGFPANGAGEIAKAALYRRWLALEPEGALRHCRKYEEDLLPRLLGNHAVTDPDGAAERLLELPPADGVMDNEWGGDAPLRKRAWAELARTALLKGPDAALETIRRAWKSEPWVNDIGMYNITPVLGMVARDLDPETFSAWSEGLPDPLRDSAREALCERLVERDGMDGWRWMTEQEDAGALRRTAWEALLRKDLPGAFALLDGIDPERRDYLAGNVDGKPELTDKVAALRAATELSPATRQALARRLLEACEPEDLESAEALLPLAGKSLEPRDLRELLGPWAVNDPDRGQRWVETLPEGPIRAAAAECWRGERERADRERGGDVMAAERNQAMLAAWDNGTRISNHWREAGSLDHAALEASLKTERNQKPVTPGELAVRLAAENPAAAAAWLASREANGAGDIAEFSAHWGRTDPAAAAAWAGGLPEGTRGRNAVYNVAREYARYAPARAEAWVGALPSGAMRDAAAKGLAER